MLKIKDVIGGIKEKEEDKNLSTPKIKQIDSNVVYAYNSCVNTKVEIDEEELDKAISDPYYQYLEGNLTIDEVAKESRIAIAKAIETGKVVKLK